jgi:osmoprotectant transport system permease protein
VISLVRGMGDYLGLYGGQVLRQTGWHAILSVVPVIIGLVISIPLGWLANRVSWTYPPLVTLAGVLYTIPSLALFVLMPPLLGTRILDPINVVIALSVYTVALLVRVVADALASVPDDVAQSALAMGFNGFQRFFRIDLPVAVPVIAAGLRVAVVSNVSLVSVAAVIGIPQLGQLFTIGFQNSNYAPIVLGIIGCLILALIFDALILLALRLLTPWRVARSGS